MASFLDVFRSKKENRSNPFNDPNFPMNEMNVNAFLESYGGQHRSDSGEIVNIHTSLQTSTVWACVNLISTQIAINPLFTYQYDDAGSKNLAIDHDYFDLINSGPNPEQDSIAFRMAVQMSIEVTGNGYIEIQRNQGGRAVALWHRASQRTTPVHVPDSTSLNGMRLVYRTSDTYDSHERIIESENMIHIMGLTLNGWIGLNPLEYFRGSIGAKLAMDKFAGRFFANNSTPSGILSTVKKLKPEDKSKMRTDWESLQGIHNQRRVAVLDEELKFQPIGVSQTDSQFTESKIEIAKEIAASFGVQGYAVGLLDKGIKANVEQAAQDLYNYCLRPRMAKWEKAFTRKLFSSRGRSAGRYVVQYDVFKLLHPDDASIQTSIQSSIQNGIICPNEGRAWLGLNSIGPKGDTHYIQLNMQTLELANATGPVDDQPDTELALEQEENSLPRLGASYRGLFKDGVSRLLKTTNRDYRAVYRCLWPTIDAMSQAASQTIAGPHPECDKAVDDLIIKIEHRAKKWAESDLEAIVAEELKRVATALIYAVNRDEANAKSATIVAQLSTDETEAGDDENV